jgi:hypothetical protein
LLTAFSAISVGTNSFRSNFQRFAVAAALNNIPQRCIVEEGR